MFNLRANTFGRRVLRAVIIGGVIAGVVFAIKRRRGSPAVEGSRSGSPSDQTTVTRLVDDSGDAGYANQFVLQAAAAIKCLACLAIRHASEYSMDALRRMEGASDPDDAVAVIALRCPACDAQGTMVLNYGPSGSPEEGDVLLAMQDKRIDSSVATGTAPGEDERQAIL